MNAKNKGGRPKKKPGYDQAAENKKVISKAVALFKEPYDDRVERSVTSPTLQSAAEEMNTTPVRLRKILITAGYYSTAKSRLIQRLFDDGYSIPEIMAKTTLSVASVFNYLPYSKSIFKLEDPSLRAIQGRNLRRRQKACENLQRDPNEETIWKAVLAFEGYLFKSDGGNFKYSIDGEEMVFSQRRISKDELIKEYQRIKSIRGAIDRTQCIGCLYLVFVRLGICS